MHGKLEVRAYLGFCEFNTIFSMLHIKGFFWMCCTFNGGYLFSIHWYGKFGLFQMLWSCYCLLPGLTKAALGIWLVLWGGRLSLRLQQFLIWGWRQHIGIQAQAGNRLLDNVCAGVSLKGYVNFLCLVQKLSKIICFLYIILLCHEQRGDVTLLMAKHDALLILLYNSLKGWY